MSIINRSKSCPQCRNKVTERCINRVYFNFASGEGIVEDATSLQAKLDNVNFQLRQKEADMKEKLEKIKTLEERLSVNESLLKGCEKKLVTKETAILALKDQLEYCKVQSRETERLRSENNKLEKSLNTLNGLQKVLNSTKDEVDQMLEDYKDVKILATFASALKSALTQAESKKNSMRSQLQATKTELSSEKNLVVKLHTRIKQLEEQIANMEQKREQNKRKWTDVGTSSDECDESPAKMSRLSVTADVHVTNTSATTNLNETSIDSIIKRIEQADSPYLQLKQGSGAGLATLRVRNTSTAAHVKPTEIISLQKSHSALHFNHGSSSKSSKETSIFNSKQLNRSLDMFMDDMEGTRRRLETSYDGLGGHSKPDLFPIPLKRSPVKSCVPKITPKHRLKNPNKPATIGKFFQKMSQNK